jgi:hypothetical protein
MSLGDLGDAAEIERLRLLLRRIRAALVDQRYALGLNPEMELIFRELEEFSAA